MKKDGKRQHSVLLLVSAIPFLLILAACVCCNSNLEQVNYTPLPGDDWKVSTPAEQGLDPKLVSNLYGNASKVDTLHALLVIKNGYLVAEGYFNGGSIEEKSRIQSVTKSYTSALVGIALERGYLEGVDQKMVEFFPELADRIRDRRKNEITIRHMLQMRAGYPWEESTKQLFELLYSGFRPSNLIDVPLVRNPGTDFEYSNLTSHLLGVIVARAADTDLKSFAEQNLFAPINVEVGDWIKDWAGYYNGHADLHFTARDMAKFGLLYLSDGKINGKQIIPAEWVLDSLQTYSEDAWDYRVGQNFNDIGYGYLWWSVRAGDHQYNLAWGHGGQQIALVDPFDMVVVVKADPLFGRHGGGPWKREKANLNLVADFISSLPSQ